MRFAVRLHTHARAFVSRDQVRLQHVRSWFQIWGTHGSVNSGMRLTACKGTPAICACTYS